MTEETRQVHDIPDKHAFASQFIEKLTATRGVSPEEADLEDLYMALAALVKERINANWVATNNRYMLGGTKQVYYFSLEFMLGRMLEQNILALGLLPVCRETMKELGIDLDEIFRVENDPGLGNGGLGRLAACFMDSLANLGLPGHGCSIRYKHGLFEQKIIDGNQIEVADNWLRSENVWEIKKPKKAVTVKFSGDVRVDGDGGATRYVHENYETVIAMPYDVPMVGGANGVVNNLRLWGAEAEDTRQFNFASFSGGDYVQAISDKYSAEAISEVLYPDSSNYRNRVLRLKQQYFFVSAGLQSIVRHFKKAVGDLRKLPKRVSVHINDTHPALAVPELMRILMDEEGFGWDEAWDITVNTISYTNHTVLPEALERWPSDTFRVLLPRIYMITHEINERFCKELWKLFPGNWDRIARMAIEGDGEIRMAFLAIVGSHSVNGVAKVHSEILKKDLFREFYEIYPRRFRNVTNGVTQRRWVEKANPALAELIDEAITPVWRKEPLKLALLDTKGLVNDAAFLEKLTRIKRDNKLRLANMIMNEKGLLIDPDSIFDVQVKRFHAYKRQLLMAFNIIALYNDIVDGKVKDVQPRTFLFGGKAAPSYYFAKETIRFISAIANRVNNDERVRGLIKVVFLENYRVSSAETIFPASDVSEQISTAGLEASGTGNMKFMFNGAVTIGTMDGANIEIFDAVGAGNYVRFGLTVEDVAEIHRTGSYRSWDTYERDPRLKRIIDEWINTSPGLAWEAKYPNIYDAIITHGDEFFVLRDFDAYVNAQREINRLYGDRSRWAHMSAMNIAYAGVFSSDEVIRNYATAIWQI